MLSRTPIFQIYATNYIILNYYFLVNISHFGILSFCCNYPSFQFYSM